MEQPMSKKYLTLTDSVYDYLQAVSVREPNVLKRLREETASMPNFTMQISPDQGQFMALLVQLINASKTLEVGVFTGYSSLSVALALPTDGKLIACDVSDEYTQVARRYWAEAGVAGKVSLRLAPALETLDGLINEGQAGTFDFAFIDADKGNYDGYYERALKLVRKGGLITIDNVLWGGKVADDNAQDADTVAIRALNEKLLDDQRVSLSLLPIADGLTLALKR
jgi:predicted O-methyltransferase YrrM